MREWFLSADLINLDTMPSSTAGISQKAKRDNWLSRKAKGGGRSLEYHIDNFEDDVRYQLYCKEYGETEYSKWKIEDAIFKTGAVEQDEIDAVIRTIHSPSDANKEHTARETTNLYKIISEEIDIDSDTVASWDDEGTLESNIQKVKYKKAKQTELTDNFNNPAPINGHSIRLDFYDIDVSAGCGALALQEDKADPITFDKDFLINSLEVLPDDVFLMPVRGDSMLPTLKNQAIIMVKRIDIFAMDGIYVFRYNGQLMVKRLQFSKTGLTVVSDNPTYKTWELTPEEAETEDFEILGEVIWSGQRI